MELLYLLCGLFIVISLLACYFNMRLNAQDKYLSIYMKSFANYTGSEDFKISVPDLDTTEILNERKPQVYSPRYDQDAIMSGKVIDPFD